MSEKGPLRPENYYDGYGEGFGNGWDLGLMYERLSHIELPEDLKEKLRAKDTATFLLLGSATPNNMYHISRIDKHLRPGKVEQDHVIVIDQNIYPLVKHQKAILSIEGKDGWSNTPQSTPEFPLPKFDLVQGDIRELPFAEHSIDVAVTDYTFNYLDSLEEVNKAFREIARSLSSDGVLLISVRGNEKYSYSEEINPQIQDGDIQEVKQGGVQVHYFPLQTYVQTAKKYGLETIGHSEIGTDLCAILIKKDHA